MSNFINAENSSLIMNVKGIIEQKDRDNFRVDHVCNKDEIMQHIADSISSRYAYPHDDQRLYIVYLSAQGNTFLVCAHEHDIFDVLLDYLTEYEKTIDNPIINWLLTPDEERVIFEAEGYIDDYISGGNEGRYLNEHTVRIEEIKIDINIDLIGSY